MGIKDEIEEYCLGIDCGTGGVRVGIFRTNGALVIFQSCPVDNSYPAVGKVEQNPKDWWDALVKATRGAIEKSGVDVKKIVGASISATTSTLLVLDKNHEPLREALMWCDVRATKQAERVAASGDPMLKYNGFGNVSAEWAMPKMMWIKEEEPEIWAKTEYICDCQDYFGYRLTGEMASSLNIVTMRWYYDDRNGGWPVDFYNNMGLEDAIEKFPKQILPMGDKLGKGLSKEAADALGLWEGMPVGEGGCDAYVASIALGVLKPGSVAMITGTSNLQYAMLDKPVTDKALLGAFPDLTMMGYYGLEGGQSSSGGVIKWLMDSGFCDGYKQRAEAQGVNALQLLGEEAEKLPIGSEGLLMLEYLQGNRTPWVDCDVRGMMYGLALKHTPAHFYRAVLEASCYGTGLIIKNFRKYIDNLDRICICGGLTNSELYLHILADVCGVSLYIPEQTDSSCLGAAILGSFAGGAFKSIEEAVQTMVFYTRRIDPDEKKHEEYKFYLDHYEQAYLVMKDWMHEVSLHAAEQEAAAASERGQTDGTN